MGAAEEELIREVFASNWIAPLGPQVDAFEQEFAQTVNVAHAAALSSGTAALHLALILAGVASDDEVLVSTLTFAGSVNPIRYLGARPVLIDSEKESWNIDPALISDAIRRKAREGRAPKAAIIVHLYGQPAELDPIMDVCEEFGVVLIEDAAESLGALYGRRPTGSVGRMGVFSFNGNKIITTSGGGMLVSDDEDIVGKARWLASQARDAAPHYEHSSVGYNYRMSNLLAAVGRGQLRVLPERVSARREVFQYYQAAFQDLPGIDLMPEAPWGRHSRWLTTLTINPDRFGADREEVRLKLEAHNVEGRPLWKPMHLQPVFADYESITRGVADRLFERGLCLPSGSSLTKIQLDRIVSIVRSCYHAGAA